MSGLRYFDDMINDQISYDRIKNNAAKYRTQCSVLMDEIHNNIGSLNYAPPDLHKVHEGLNAVRIIMETRE